MAQKVKVSTYIKNVGKSFGYSVREVASEYAPIAASTAKDFKSTVRDMKISMQEIKNNSISNATKDFSKGENFLTNTLDDLKTGKWYNQERKDKAENEMFGFDSFDFDFDDEDWGDDSDSDGVDTSSILEHDEMSTNQIISSMGQVGSEISKSLGYTSAKSAEYIVANNNASTRALYDLNAKGFNQVSSILMNMSGNIAGLVQLGEPLAAHMQNSSVFYTQTTESLSRISEDVNKMSSNLQILVDRTSYMDKKGSVKENKNGFGRFMSGGDFSLSSYMDMVKENVKDQADSVKSIISMMEMMMGKNGKNSSLTESIVKGTVNKLIPTITKDIVKQFDEALSASLGNGLMRVGKSVRNKGFLASMLADMLLPKEVVKNGVNPSNYEKGPVSWDGIARQSLTYVIPTYLAQMTALLAGVNDEKDYQYYDFKSGKFTTKRVYQRDKEFRDRARARSVGGEFEDIALKSTGNKQMQKEIEEFFYQAMLNGGNFYDIKKGKTDANWRKKYGNISEETVELLLQVLEANNGKGPNKNRNAASKWETRNNQAIADNARRMQEEELLGYSFENRFADGTSDFILRSAVGSGRGKGRGAGERNQSVYRTPFNASRESINSGNGWRQNDDGTYTVGPNDAIITASDFGKWLDAFESGDVKTARKIENTKAMKDTKEKASSMAKNIGSKAMDKMGLNNSKVTNVMDLLERGRDVIQTPMYAVTMALDSLNRGINNLFWGDGSEEGVIDKLKKKISNVWDKIKDKFDDLFGTKSYRALKDMGLSDQFVDIVRTVDKRGYIRYYGVDANGKKKPVSKKVGETYEEQTRKKSLKEAMSDEWTKIKESFKNQQQAARQRREALTADLAKFKEMSAGLDNGNAAAGRQVTKAGFAIVSEGEMIVPSEFNPYYHGATNKASQIANENRIRRNFFGSFANGGVVYNKINGNIYTDNKGGYYEYNSKTKEYDKIDIKDSEGRKKVASGYKNAIASSGPVGAISEGAKTLASGIMDFINGIMGKNDKKAQEQEKKNIFASIKQSFIDAGNEKGALGIGAITGVGVSLLTGAVVGPLAGAAIGAGVGLATKSQAFQDLLFGKGDPESNDYRKGLLGSIGEKLKDKNNQAILKNMGIGGGAGLIAGTFMGSPILGLVAGSTIGYVSKSQKAQEFLFGTEDEKTALGKLKDKVKEASPNIAAGALAGLIAGPFGVVGNLLVGSGLGYMTTSERFKKFMFGDGEKDKGLVGKIHDKIINPLDEIMHNLKNAFTGITRRLSADIFGFFKKLGNRAKKAVGNASEKDNFLGKVLRGVGTVGEKVIGGTVGAVGGVLDRVDTGLKKSNLNTGRSVYNKALGRNETAAERMQTRQTIRNGGVATEQDANGNTIYYKVNANGKKTLINEKKYNNIIAKNEKRGGYHENRKFGKIDEAISGMDEETINNLTNKNNKEDARLKLAEILGKDADKIKNSDLAQFISLLGDEKSGRFSKEDKEKDKETKQNTMLDTINDNIPKATTYLEEIRDKVLGKISKNKKSNKNQTENLGNSGDNLENNGEETVTQTDMFGNIHQYTKNNQGELTEVNNDNETKKSRKLINSFTENIGGIGKIGAAIGGIGGILGSIKNGLLGNGEKKPGLLSKLFNGLFGEEGALSGILSLFTGEKGSVKTLVKGIFSKGGASIFKTMLTDIGIGALIYAGFSGKLDSIVSSIAGLGGKGAEDAFASESKNKSTTYDVTLQDGTTTTASKDENGNFVDPSGNILNVKSVNKANQNNVASFSDKLKENTVRGIVTGTGSVSSKLLGKTSIGSAVGRTATTAFNAIGDSAKVASFADDILNGVIKFTSSLKNIPGLKFMADKLDDMGLALAEKIQPVLMSQTAKSISSIASTAVVWAKVALIVVDFTTGYEDARTTLGIVKEPTVGQRVLSGLLRAIKNFIPIIGSLIPDSLVIDVFCNYIAPALGIDVDELKNAREEAQQTVDAYNQTTGKDLSVAEFTKSVMKDYTWTERIGNAAKGTWEDTKAKAKNFGNSIKENGIVGTFKNMGAEAISTFKESFSANGGGISGIISGIGDTFGNMLPGVLGEITKKNAEIKSLAFKGDLKGLWDIGLDDFSGGGEDIEGTDLKTAVPSIFSKIVGQIPLIMSKLICTPIALVMKIVGNIKDKVGDIIGGIKEKVSGVADKVKDTASNLWNGASNFISGIFSGGSSGFVSQYDPRYQKYQVSGQQFGAKGCGPAVASMAASALGKNLSVGDAVRASNGYQTNNGVTLDYFQNALGSRGINTEIIAGGSSADMYRKIASGEKVILLGQDATNTSKKNSPFGPNNHYVLATGVDRRGNIIVNDPESKGPRTYSPSILTHAKYGIAGSNSGIRSNRTSKIFRFISGAGNPRNDAITQQIWAYLTTKLGMSEAAAAGIMGNMEQESGCQPDIKQKGGGAYGICQWDGGRRDKLKQFPNYQSLSVQLDYLASELPSQYWKKSGTISDVDGKSYSYKSMSYDDFKKLNDVAEATIKFEVTFERAGKPHLAKRINYAKAYYEMFSGKTYTIDSSVGATTSSGATDSSTSGSSKSGGILNILSTITSAFSNAFRGGTNEPVTKENSQETQTTGIISNSSSSSALIGNGNPATGDMVNNFPYYNQGEEPWKNETYGTGTIKSSGCGPTSMAMVMKSYGSNVTPSDTAKWSVENGYRIPNQGTSWGFFKGIGDKSGFDVSQFGSSETAKQSLLAGIPVIGSMKSGDFTKRGHYIVFSGISKDGSKVYVNDPASRTRSGKVWDTNNAFSQAKQFWAISKNGKGSINTSAAGSGILNYSDLAMAAGGSSGLLMSSRAGANTPGVATFRDSRTGRLLPVRVSGGESDIVGMTSTMLNNVKTSVSNVVSKAKSGTVSAELVAELLKSITNILNNIADNTAPVAKIYNALAAYISSGGGASMDKVTVKKKPETPVAGGSNEVDSNIAALAGVLAELAKG